MKPGSERWAVISGYSLILLGTFLSIILASNGLLGVGDRFDGPMLLSVVIAGAWMMYDPREGLWLIPFAAFLLIVGVWPFGDGPTLAPATVVVCGVDLLIAAYRSRQIRGGI